MVSTSVPSRSERTRRYGVAGAMRLSMPWFATRCRSGTARLLWSRDGRRHQAADRERERGEGGVGAWGEVRQPVPGADEGGDGEGVPGGRFDRGAAAGEAVVPVSLA